jgi:hypothetical protein
VIYLEDDPRDTTGVYAIVKFGIFNGNFFITPLKLQQTFLPGGFSRENKSLRRVGRVRRSESVRSGKARAAGKEAILVEKTELMLNYRLLIERNRRRSRPLAAVPLPSMFLAFDDVGSGEVKRSLDGAKLEIVAPRPPTYFSPMEVFRPIGFGAEGRKGGKDGDEERAGSKHPRAVWHFGSGSQFLRRMGGCTAKGRPPAAGNSRRSGKGKPKMALQMRMSNRKANHDREDMPGQTFIVPRE